MKFEFEIDDEEISNVRDYCGCSFQKRVYDEAVTQCADELITTPSLKEAEQIVREIIKERKQEIIDKVVIKVTERVENKILKTREIAELTPKVSELKRINRDNEEYFMELIDKALARKFR